MRQPKIAADAERSLRLCEPFLWLNNNLVPVSRAQVRLRPSLRDIYDAEARLSSYGGLLMHLFPELRPTVGTIESPLYHAGKFQAALSPGCELGRWLIKGDHALPVAGSIKARGGIYEVLLHAEALALRHGLLSQKDDRGILASPRVRALYGEHVIAVGSTGNLGLSIGIIATALGFRAKVHMSGVAKSWKIDRLRARGVEVIRHNGDFGAAVASGREIAREDSRTYFVDDENSWSLFFGYSVAALRLQRQLAERHIQVDAQHPLFVYLPCGVGGAPGGISFGLRTIFGDHVHCFLAEPVSSPCMLVRLAVLDDRPCSVSVLGLDNRTEADGLAVGKASELAAGVMRHLVSGVFTVRDEELFEDLYRLEVTEGLRIEPSAAACLRGPQWILHSEAGRRYQRNLGIAEVMDKATHVLWTTGGSLVPEDEYHGFHERGAGLWESKNRPTGRS
ncbi:MAG TPA: D-serine ammonia-lyase [Steroidobacteraceae bacterium]|nr:D-serine ammonia-lyase [Steroidobacteraceae bacterium]